MGKHSSHWLPWSGWATPARAALCLQSSGWPALQGWVHLGSLGGGGALPKGCPGSPGQLCGGSCSPGTDPMASQHPAVQGGRHTCRATTPPGRGWDRPTEQCPELGCHAQGGPGRPVPCRLSVAPGARPSSAGLAQHLGPGHRGWSWARTVVTSGRACVQLPGPRLSTPPKGGAHTATAFGK